MHQDGTNACILALTNILVEKKIFDIWVGDVSEVASITDFLIVGTAMSSPHQKVVAEILKKKIKELEIENVRYIHGGAKDPWFLIDASFFMIHLFLEDARKLYSLETMWEKAVVLYPSKGMGIKIIVFGKWFDVVA